MKKKYEFTFSCTTCGSCCREEGYVFFSSEDVSNAAKSVNISEKSFIKKYLTKHSSKIYRVDVTRYTPCPFLKSDNKCKIDSGKPVQCKTFPYWSEYVNWEGHLVHLDRKCPGIKIIREIES